MDETTSAHPAPSGTSASPSPVTAHHDPPAMLDIGGIAAPQVFSPEDIAAWVNQVATDLHRLMAESSSSFTFVCIQQGADRLFADLTASLVAQGDQGGFKERHLQAYRFLPSNESKLEIGWIDDAASSLSGHTVVLVEDVVRSGRTLDAVIKFLEAYGAAKIITVVLCTQRELEDREYERPLDYVGIPLGYGDVFGHGVGFRVSPDPRNDPFRNHAGLYVMVGGVI